MQTFSTIGRRQPHICFLQFSRPQAFYVEVIWTYKCNLSALSALCPSEFELRNQLFQIKGKVTYQSSFLNYAEVGVVYINSLPFQPGGIFQQPGL